MSHCSLNLVRALAKNGSGCLVSKREKNQNLRGHMSVVVAVATQDDETLVSSSVQL